VWLGELPVAVLRASGTLYVASDQLGSPWALIGGGAGASQVSWLWDHDPFGNGAPSAAAGVAYNPRFPGQYYDAAAGLHYNGARDYNPRLGRYIESDPIGLQGGLNTYAYADGNPLSKVDPNGKNALLATCFAGGPANPVCDAAVAATIIGSFGVLSVSKAAIEAEITEAKKVHGNSHLSQDPTELYYLINRTTGDIDKIGITANPSGRYSQVYLQSENVDYLPKYQFSSRYPAVVAENIELTTYFLSHGRLPRLNQVFR